MNLTKKLSITIIGVIIVILTFSVLLLRSNPDTSTITVSDVATHQNTQELLSSNHTSQTDTSSTGHIIAPTTINLGITNGIAVQLLQIPLALSSFISGIFYGIFSVAIISTLTIYHIFKPKKWALLVSLQLLILCAYISCELLSITADNAVFFKNYIQSLISVGMIMLALLLVSVYFPFSIKRIMYKYERKIYTLFSIVALFFFALNHLSSERYSIIVHLLTFTFLILTQYLIFKLNKKNRYAIYILLILSLTLFYSLCFMPSHPDSNLMNYTATMTSLKLSSIFIVAFNIFTNFTFLKKREKQNQTNEVYVSQYVMLLKNYHKLLMEEKNTQIIQLQKKEVTTLKEHIDNLCEHLKNHHKLTDREIEVLYLIWDGKTNKEIATALNITLSTTKYHISNIYIKLNVNSRPQVFALKEW